MSRRVRVLSIDEGPFRSQLPIGGRNGRIVYRDVAKDWSVTVMTADHFEIPIHWSWTGLRRGPVVGRVYSLSQAAWESIHNA